MGNDSAVCFDTDTLSLAGGWIGGFLDLRRCNLDNAKGELPAIVPSPLQFSTNTDPGWAKGGTFVDPRPSDGGPLPVDWAHYRGLYRHGDQVVFSYTVGQTDVLELDGSIADAGHVAFTRTLRMNTAADATQAMNVCELRGATAGIVPLTDLSRAGGAGSGGAESSAAVLSRAGNDTIVAVLHPPKGAILDVSDSFRVQLKFPLGKTGPVTFKVLIATLPKASRTHFANLLKMAATVEDPEKLCHGGPSRWPRPIITQGTRAADKAAYVVDTVAMPDDNPWQAWMRASGFDFFSDGRAAVCTWNGDVWIASGLGDTLSHVTWRRFAAGLYEALGLKIVNDEIYVLGRDQITRLHDLDGDGEADYYENFCNAWPASPVYHAFNLDLQADSKGNFYFTTCGNAAALNMRMKGVILKVPKEGGRAEIVCHGLRAANGLGMGPGDELVCSDNQGHWTPVDRINWIAPGGFYGYVCDPRRLAKGQVVPVPDHFEPPLCWIRYPNPDNSAGALAWAGKSWGPLSGQLLCTSYGKSTLLAVLQEEVDGVHQGGVVKLPLKFDAGIMRARVNPRDGQVWVSGLKGWQTNASRDGCLQRVRYTGKAANMPIGLHVLPTGLSITFSDALDPELAVDEGSYSVSQWTYHWTSAYGSPEFKASLPNIKGRDEVPIKSVKLSADHKTVTLETSPLKPVMQMAIEMHLKAADGTDIAWEIDNTINRVK